MKYPKTGYENRSIEFLFRAYQFENDRISREDAAITKRLIRTELLTRVKRALEILDAMDDESRVHPFYEEQFLAGR